MNGNVDHAAKYIMGPIINVTVHVEPSVKSHIANSCYRSNPIIIQFTHPIIAKFSGS